MADDSRRHSRSRSPPRKSNKSGGGFRWKEKRPRDADSYDDHDKRDGGLHRGYRNRSPRRDYDRPSRDSDRDRDRRWDRDQDRVGDRDGYGSRRGRDNDFSRDRRGRRDNETDKDRPRRDDDRDCGKEREKDGSGDSERGTPSGNKQDRDRDPDRNAKKEKKPAAAPKISEPMIMVTVNDRLGSKTQVPCLGSDTIGQFKMIVAMHIGRKPHEIMLKRQGERPFKDHITVADYGISNGVQLDLEVDTGD